MKLRTRIYAGFAVLLLVFVGVAAVVVLTQRNRLIAQVDDQLTSVAPLNRRAPRTPIQPPPGGEGQPLSDDQETRPAESPPISDLYIAALDGGDLVRVLVQGQLLDTVPIIDPIEILASADRFVMLDAVDGTTTFRALIDRPDASEPATVIALPMNDVEESIRQLGITLGLLAMFAAGVLALLAAWIARLGLRPISEMTVAATAVAAGDRDQRVPTHDPRTEAGQLAAAFNEMLDQRDRAEDRLRRFVSDASHELRTPLTSVKGYLDLYEQGGFREPGQLDDAVGRIQSEADRMAALVEDLLALARFDEEQPLHRSPVEVATLVADVVADSSASHPDRIVVADVEPHLPAVMLDHDKVHQLLLNLVANALTHAPSATVRILGQRDGADLRLVVIDDGPGMSEDQAARAFERFYRGDPARTRSTGGSGLGLSIAHAITTAHGGTITLTTSPGAGCAFTIRLPLV